MYQLRVLLLDMVENSTSPLRTHFRLAFSSVDAPEGVLHPLRQRTYLCFPLPQTAPCSLRARRLMSCMRPFGCRASAIRDSTALPAPSIVGWFCRLPWREYASGSVAPPSCHLVRAAAPGPLAVQHEGVRNGSRLATIPDGQADVEAAVRWPRYGGPVRRCRVGWSDSLARYKRCSTAQKSLSSVRRL